MTSERSGNVLVMLFLAGILVGLLYGLSGTDCDGGTAGREAGTGSIAYVWDITEFDL